MRLSGRSGSMAKKAISGYDVHTANIPLERFFLFLFWFFFLLSSSLFSILFLVTHCFWVSPAFSTVFSPGLLGLDHFFNELLFACGVFMMYTYIGNIHEREGLLMVSWTGVILHILYLGFLG